MKYSLIITVAAAFVLVLAGCGKEDYRAHETETFMTEKMIAFSRLSNMREALKSALWEPGDEKTDQLKCKIKFAKAVGAASLAKKTDSDFNFACKGLKCKWGQCRYHSIQAISVSVACTTSQMIDTSLGYEQPITDKQRQAIQSAIDEIDKTIAILEAPENFIKR